MNYKKLRRLCSMAAVVLVLFSALVLPTAADDVQLPEFSVLPGPVPLTIGYTALTDTGEIVSTYSILNSLTPTDSSNNIENCYSLSGVNDILSSYFSLVPDPDHTELLRNDTYGDWYGTSVFDFTGSSTYDTGDVAGVMFYDDIRPVYIHAEDFYCWSENTFSYDYNWDSEFILRLRYFPDTITSDTNGLVFHSARIVWGTAGSTDRHVLDIGADDPNADDFRDGDFWVDCSFWTDSNIPGQVYYIYSFDVVLNRVYPENPIPSNVLYEMEGSLVNNFVPELRDFDVTYGEPIFDPEGNPAVPLMSYVTWLGTAASGFLELQIFPGFRIGGLLMTVIAFAFVMWFLKVFAGG